VVVFAVYDPGIKDAVRQYADQLAGKVVVDITNPVDTQTWDRLATAPGSSSAEETQQLVPEGAPVVKAFNTTFAGTLMAGEAAGQQLDVLTSPSSSPTASGSPAPSSCTPDRAAAALIASCIAGRSSRRRRAGWP
jgi:8-hydroxy-5-deazaflavin:NADPH oxidoreductase